MPSTNSSVTGVEGLYKAFVPFLIGCVGLLWVLVAGQLLAKRPTAQGPDQLRKAGWGLASLAGVWFVIAANPTGMVSSLARSASRPLTIGVLALTVGAALATRFMWSRPVAQHFGTTRATIGWINYLLDLVGVTDAGAGQGWLTDRSTALLSMVVVFAWMQFGFNTVLYLAGHQGVPKELYEAAEIDGANPWQIFRRITVPQLRATTFYVVVTTSILALQLFDIVWILSLPEAGGPGFATQTPVLTLYLEAFRENKQGYASALAWILFIGIFGLTSIQFRSQRDEASSGGLS